MIILWQVSINGYVIFDDQLKRPFKPSNETVLEGQSIIAPYWTDIEIPEKSNTSKLFHLELSLENALKYNKTKAYFDQSAQIQSIMNESKIQTDLTSPTFIAVLTWSEVLPHKAEKFANLQVCPEVWHVCRCVYPYVCLLSSQCPDANQYICTFFPIMC